jgi:hypothetical protein
LKDRLIQIEQFLTLGGSNVGGLMVSSAQGGLLQSKRSWGARSAVMRVFGGGERSLFPARESVVEIGRAHVDLEVSWYVRV